MTATTVAPPFGGWSGLFRAGIHPGARRKDLPCQSADPELFFPPDRKHGWSPEPAKAVCRRCPIIAECKEWAVAAGPCLYGVYGATTPTERDAIRAKRREAGDG